jgi:XTP/dITP diphosphohydrolase
VTELVLATRNRNKIRELREIVKKTKMDLSLLSLDDFSDVPKITEDGKDFRENAVKKATLLAKAVGRLALADDSGLVVDAIDGRPGVCSARFAGEEATDRENNEKLLKLLRDVPEKRRQATFVCYVALADPEKLIEIVEGRCTGVIVSEETGSGGFGYDPVFQPIGYGKTFAELPAEVKNRISHRARAMEKALMALDKYIYKKELADQD